MSEGILYVVATPLGNLDDITRRALKVLSDVDVIAAEDTRHSRTLLSKYDISTPCVAVHEHNERRVADKLVADLCGGKTIALISDAGTPLISDPGYYLVATARQQGCSIVPIPGPSALVCALSVSGLPSDRFVFEGFLPSRSAARKRHLQSLCAEQRTIIFYESPHRIEASLQDMSEIFGGQRQAVLARELTKMFETVIADTLQDLLLKVQQDVNQKKGEMVILVQGAAVENDNSDVTVVETLQVLLEELPLKQAVALTAKLTGGKRNQIYEMAVGMVRGEGKE